MKSKLPKALPQNNSEYLIEIIVAGRFAASQPWRHACSHNWKRILRVDVVPMVWRPGMILMESSFGKAGSSKSKTWMTRPADYDRPLGARNGPDI